VAFWFTRSLESGRSIGATGLIRSPRTLTTYPENADVHRLARLEAQRMGGREDDGEHSRLGVRHGQYLRSETSGSPTQVCPPNGYSAFMLLSQGLVPSASCAENICTASGRLAHVFDLAVAGRPPLDPDRAVNPSAFASPDLAEVRVAVPGFSPIGGSIGT
jgi:hypothetical protein